MNYKKTELDISLKIYNELYVKTSRKFNEVFLCGGASFKKKLSYRDRLRKQLSKYENIRILYPEELFMEILNTNKSSDLLSLENFLAENSDFICIVCESPGSFVELGAFVNDEKLRERVIVLTNKKYKRDQSFINQGPIKLLKNKVGKERVVYYEEDDEKTISYQLWKLLDKKTINKKPLISIVGLYHFLPMLLYFFEELNYEKIKKILTFITNSVRIESNDKVDESLRSALKLLFKEKMIFKNKSYYHLTDKGFLDTKKDLYKISMNRKSSLLDSIRLELMRIKYY